MQRSIRHQGRSSRNNVSKSISSHHSRRAPTRPRSSQRPVRNHQRFITTTSSTHSHSDQHASSSDTTTSHPPSLTYQSSLDYCRDQVNRVSPEMSFAIELLPSSEKPLAYGLRALQIELDSTAQRIAKPELAHLRTEWWRSQLDIMRVFILAEHIEQMYGKNSIEMQQLLRTSTASVAGMSSGATSSNANVSTLQSTAPCPAAQPVLHLLTHVLGINGLGVDFRHIVSIPTAYPNLLPSAHGFTTLEDYIRNCDAQMGAMQLALLSAGAHTLSNAEEPQPLAKSIATAGLAYGRIEGLYRLLIGQPATLNKGFTWIPHDILASYDIYPEHIQPIGPTLLEYPHIVWLHDWKQGIIPDLQIGEGLIRHVNTIGLGDVQLERTLAKMRSTDPSRCDEANPTEMPLQPIMMSTLRQNMLHVNKNIVDIIEEQIIQLRQMTVNIPKPLRVYFAPVNIIEQYCQVLKRYQYDVLHPDVNNFGSLALPPGQVVSDPKQHIWDALKLRGTMAFKAKIGVF